MGEVYVAEDERLHRKVALKILPAEVTSDPQRRERLALEARAVAALNHPNIVTIHSIEEAEGIHFLTMELVEGATLAERIPPAGLPLREILDLAIPLADAVATAHAKGITHRDLKPANIMVCPEGRLKVLDFGLAKLQEPAAGSALDGTRLTTRVASRRGPVRRARMPQLTWRRRLQAIRGTRGSGRRLAMPMPCWGRSPTRSARRPWPPTCSRRPATRWKALFLGEQDAALDLLESLLSRPGPLTAAMLKVDPIWNPLRGNPRFQTLLKKHALAG